MAIIELETNGDTITNKHQQVIDTWMKYLEDNLSVRTFSLFYYSPCCTVFADCILQNNHYGRFEITEKSILFIFEKYTATREESEVFERATWNDYRYYGKLNIAE